MIFFSNFRHVRRRLTILLPHLRTTLKALVIQMKRLYPLTMILKTIPMTIRPTTRIQINIACHARIIYARNVVDIFHRVPSIALYVNNVFWKEATTAFGWTVASANRTINSSLLVVYLRHSHCSLVRIYHWHQFVIHSMRFPCLVSTF